MMSLFPWLAWVAVIASGVLLAIAWFDDDGAARWRLGLLTAWFILAGYFQFYGPSELVRAVGLAAQSLLAIVLIARSNLA